MSAVPPPAAPERSASPSPRGAHGSPALRGLVALMVTFGGLTLAFAAPGLSATGHGGMAVAAAVAGIVAAGGGVIALARR